MAAPTSLRSSALSPLPNPAGKRYQLWAIAREVLKMQSPPKESGSRWVEALHDTSGYQRRIAFEEVDCE